MTVIQEASNNTDLFSHGSGDLKFKYKGIGRELPSLEVLGENTSYPFQFLVVAGQPSRCITPVSTSFVIRSFPLCVCV